MLRVDNVPAVLRPAFHAFGYGGALSMQALFGALRATCTFQPQRRRRRNAGDASMRQLDSDDDSDADADVSAAEAADRRSQPRIDCIWHENVPVYLMHYLPPPPGTPRHVWLNHPAWRMRPIHVWLKWNGVERLCLGSTGHGGRDALEDVARHLKGGGCSTLMAVDGPSGPPREMKRGALDLALMTGVPLVGISFECDRSVRVPGSWDGKRYPLPGTTVRVREGTPIHVTEENYDECRDTLLRDLG